MRSIKVFFRWLHYAWTLILEGDGSWGSARLAIILGLPLCLAVAGRFLEPFDFSGGLWSLLTPEGQAQVEAMGLSFLRLNALRYWLAPLAAVIWGIALGALYLQDAFKLESFAQALNHLRASLFGLGYPTLIVMDGQAGNPQDGSSSLQSIGGPGYLEVRPGNVVLLERGAGPTNVYGAGRYFVRRFETTREIFDLREIYRNRKEVEATTKDGIAITLRNVEATFRVDTGRQPQRTEVAPYPFSIKAVRAATYARAVGKDGTVADWGDLIMSLVSGRIVGWISRQRLDRLTAPAEDDPRAAIRAEFERPDFRRQLSRFGAELVRVNIGHIDTPGPVDSQRIENWQSVWLRQDKVTLARGQALRLAYEELGRAEGQAQMLASIAQALKTVSPDEPPTEMDTIRLVFLRVSKLLETMAAREPSGEQKGPPTAPQSPKQ